MPTPGENLAQNLRQLRHERGLSQSKLADLSGLPRPTWASLESGDANPTLAVLLKVSEALQISLEELVAPPRSQAALYRRSELPKRKRGRVEITALLPDHIAGLQMERFALPPNAGMTGIPHTTGTREYLCCEQGEIELRAAGERWHLQAGDVLVFRGDQKHSYRNPGAKKAVAYSVVAISPTAG